MTVRSLVILRHAKAARPDHTPDPDRPLTARGHADAIAAGAWLTGIGYQPDLVVCSPARRTRETWLDLATALPAAPTVRYPDAAYHGGLGELVDLLRAVHPDAATVLLVGHNPAVSQLSGLLDPARADRDGLRTSGIAVHELDGGWDLVGTRPGRLVQAHTARG
jgi:phosphohistidine phosphatase